MFFLHHQIVDYGCPASPASSIRVKRSHSFVGFSKHVRLARCVKIRFFSSTIGVSNVTTPDTHFASDSMSSTASFPSHHVPDPKEQSSRKLSNVADSACVMKKTRSPAWSTTMLTCELIASVDLCKTNTNHFLAQEPGNNNVNTI